MRRVPKLIFRVAPIYPPAARRRHISGDVVLDVTLNPLLAEAARDEVTQWRYRTLVI